MTAYWTRFIARLLAWSIANVGFYLIQQRLGWVIALAAAGLTGSARVLARADFEKALEERSGLPK